MNVIADLLFFLSIFDIKGFSTCLKRETFEPARDIMVLSHRRPATGAERLPILRQCILIG